MELREKECYGIVYFLKVLEDILKHINFHLKSAALYPFQVVCAYHIGPLPQDEEGYQYILVLICAFTRWIELFPTKTTTAEATARCIHQHFG